MISLNLNVVRNTVFSDRSIVHMREAARYKIYSAIEDMC
jgi:hypothetical protein